MTRPAPLSSQSRRTQVARHHLVAAGVCALVLAMLGGHGGLSAQDQSPETFTLPSATPTPTPAPQGPADERVGVPIAPRVIPDAQESAPSASTPTSTRASTPIPAPTASSAPASPSPSPTPSRRQESAAAPPNPVRANSTPSIRNSDARGAGIGAEGSVDPGFESLEEEAEGLAPRSADGWYSVDEAGSEGAAQGSSATAGNAAPPAESQAISAIWQRINLHFEAFLALIALMAVLAAILIWTRMQRRRAEVALTDAPATAPVLTAGIRASMGEGAAGQASGAAAEETVEEADSETGSEAQTSVVDDTGAEDHAWVEENAGDHNEDDSGHVDDALAEPLQLTELADEPSGESATPVADHPVAAPPVAKAAPTPPAEPSPPPPLPSAPPPTPTPTPPPVQTPAAAPKPAPTAPSTTARPALPLDVDLNLAIKSASRSMMRLSVDFTLEVTNRADKALKDLNIAGELSSVRQGAAGPAPVDKTQPLATIDRIAPRQSRRISGTLQLPIAQVSAIQQQGKPVVIPLIHFRLGTTDQTTIKRTFVAGTPSTTSTTRVQPLLLEGPPGGLPPLRAQLIKPS